MMPLADASRAPEPIGHAFTILRPRLAPPPPPRRRALARRVGLVRAILPLLLAALLAAFGGREVGILRPL